MGFSCGYMFVAGCGVFTWQPVIAPRHTDLGACCTEHITGIHSLHSSRMTKDRLPLLTCLDGPWVGANGV